MDKARIVTMARVRNSRASADVGQCCDSISRKGMFSMAMIENRLVKMTAGTRQKKDTTTQLTALYPRSM